MNVMNIDLDRDHSTAAPQERFDVIVIGGGQAGLSAGYHLARQGVSFVILDAQARVGDSWRRRWDSLRLFSPAQLDGLDGMKFPAPAGSFPTKNEMADYLAAYVRRFNLPVRGGVKVDRLTRAGGKFHVGAGTRMFEADQVVVAMSTFQKPSRPAFAGDLDPAIVQLDGGAYRGPGQLQDGATLVVGAGNSGAEIALELSRTRPVLLAGPEVGEAPFRMDSFWGRHVLVWLLMRLVFHRLLTTATPMGRKARLRHGATPLIRTRSKELHAAGIARAPRMVGAQGGLPLLEDGRTADVRNVIWCTGFTPDFSWIDLPAFGEDGKPRHARGVAGDVPGLYFLGLHFLYAMSSTMIHGVGRDARHIAGKIADRQRRTAARRIAFAIPAT